MRSLRIAFVASCLAACSAPVAHTSVDDLSVGGRPDLSASVHDLAVQQTVNDLSLSLDDLTVPPDLFGLCQNCSGNTPACDPQTGNCVVCTPANDRCPLGSFCQSQNGQFSCVSGCKMNSECAAPDGGPALPLCCNHQCTDGASDGANCAKCGTACGNKSCCNAACEDTTGDSHNCGACGNSCSGGLVMHATGSCAQSVCALVCAQGFADCDKNPANGCEANLATDPANCMGCGNFCSVAFGTGVCMNGCSIASCYAGYADCDKQYGNGCETAVSQDPKNCGACAKICSAPPNATPACMGGACGVGGCNAGFGDCDGNPNNGCETALASDPNNCGMCANNCGQVLNGVAGCTNGACVLKSCTAPFLDCNMNPNDGCEVNSSNDPLNCGACAMKCPLLANAAAACVNGACGLGACNAGFKDCDLNPQNGCEVNVLTDVNNCGGCGTVCGNGNNQCVNGVCVAQPQGCFRVADVQQIGPTKPQFTSCQSISNNGFTCNNPLIRYGNVPDGVPAMHVNDDFPTWCKQMGCNGYVANSVVYGNRSYTAPYGKLFWCAGYDEPAVKWCDWQDGLWYNQQLDGHYAQDGTAIVSITCN